MRNQTTQRPASTPSTYIRVAHPVLFGDPFAHHERLAAEVAASTAS
jgi:hypothetical protein